MNNLQLFLNNPRNILISGDAYTLSGDIVCSPEGKKYSQYYFANRYSPAKAWPDVAKDSRMVLYGLSDFIRNNLTQPITRQDVNEADCFMKQAHIGGGSLPFNRKLFDWCVEVNNGYLPLKITAILEGSTFFPNEPIITVENTVPGFGEVAAHIEALLTGYVSIATARVTRARHWLERIIDWYRLDRKNKDCYPTAQWLIHDFGFRASSCAEESEMLGRSHLLVFNGTDTFNAAYQSWRFGANADSGKSIPALAHRGVLAWTTEDECFNNLSNNANVASYVADCYNFNEAVLKIIQLAKNNPEKTYVIRPDSGDHLENVSYVINKLKDNDLVNKNIRYLDGDSINPVMMNKLIERVFDSGLEPIKFFAGFGIGGDLRNNALRDSLSSSYKLGCVAGSKPTTYRSVVKLSESIGKMSVPSPNFITRDFVNGHTVNLGHSIKDVRVVYYDGVAQDSYTRFQSPCYENFSNLQNRTINQFNDMGKMPVDYGLPENSCLSPEIKSIQKEYYDKYRSL